MCSSPRVHTYSSVVCRCPRSVYVFGRGRQKWPCNYVRTMSDDTAVLECVERFSSVNMPSEIESVDFSVAVITGSLSDVRHVCGGTEAVINANTYSKHARRHPFDTLLMHIVRTTLAHANANAYCLSVLEHSHARSGRVFVLCCAPARLNVNTRDYC